MNVIELRDKLNDLITEGHGELIVEAPCKDDRGDSYVVDYVDVWDLFGTKYVMLDS